MLYLFTASVLWVTILVNKIVLKMLFEEEVSESKGSVMVCFSILAITVSLYLLKALFS